MCSRAEFRVRCRSGDECGRPHSHQMSWCRTSPFHGAPWTMAGRVYCPSPPWLVGLRLVTQQSHSTELGVWKKAGGVRYEKEEGEMGGKEGGYGQQGGRRKNGAEEENERMWRIEQDGGKIAEEACY